MPQGAVVSRGAHPNAPAWLLFFLSAAIGEVLSGSTPPLKLLNPLGAALVFAFYGSGALLCRELALRWGGGWATILVLGASYGVVEEGLAVKSFFDPRWKDLGPLGVYGRWAGVNWVWSVQLTIYHAVFSISIPILLASLVHPARSGEPWVSEKGVRALGGLFVALTALFYAAITPYRPPLGPYLACVLVVAGLLVLARRLPRRVLAPRSDRLVRGWALYTVGFVGTVGLFALSWVLPYTPMPPAGTIAATVAWVALAAWLSAKLSGNGTAWGDLHRLALAAGALTFWILLAILQEKNPEKRGMACVGVVAALLLLTLARRIRLRTTMQA